MITRRCSTGKRSYPDEAEAKKVLGWTKSLKDPRSDYMPVRAYECPECHQWHLTSNPGTSGELERPLPVPTRGSSLTRRTPLKASKGLKRGKGLQRQKKPLRQVSEKRRDQNPEYQAAIATVMLRDRGQCQLGPNGSDPSRRVEEVECAGIRDPHHVWPQGLFPEMRCDPDVMIVCCRAHHDWIHQTDPIRAREIGVLKGIADARSA